jgi:hypothetical protein
MLAHRSAGELVVLGVALVGLLLVDHLQDGRLGHVGQLGHQLALFGAQLVLRDFQHRRVGALLSAQQEARRQGGSSPKASGDEKPRGSAPGFLLRA